MNLSMPIKYQSIVPWGRSFEEYRLMFNLSERDLDLRILGCADGPASFNAEMFRRGKRAVSVDPLYRFTAQQIRERIAETSDDVLRQTGENKDKFIWKTISSIDELRIVRMSAMEIFLEDYNRGKEQQRYRTAELPSLPFENDEYDLALCSHFLFLYTDNLSLKFHIDAVKEMCRVAKEVRIFPILDANANRSAYVDHVKKVFDGSIGKIMEEHVPYEFQKRGNIMMRIIREGVV
jgi:hypothetical protein